MIHQYDNKNYKTPAPVVQVTIRNPTDSARQVTTDALVDTGADMTCFPRALIKAVGGEPASTYSIYGIDNLFVGSANSYFLEFEMASTKKFTEVVAIGDEVILGRNLLNEFILELDGPARKLRVTVSGK